MSKGDDRLPDDKGPLGVDILRQMGITHMDQQYYFSTADEHLVAIRSHMMANGYLLRAILAELRLARKQNGGG